ncbi:hypothetical protein HMI54_003987 [Coelomomyces lativittatus]|nr:hypothetical protein HMI54_003987 [Coelomomyces lativittatus]
MPPHHLKKLLDSDLVDNGVGIELVPGISLDAETLQLCFFPNLSQNWSIVFRDSSSSSWEGCSKSRPTLFDLEIGK